VIFVVLEICAYVGGGEEGLGLYLHLFKWSLQMHILHPRNYKFWFLNSNSS
jgi:hypothetical protein